MYSLTAKIEIATQSQKFTFEKVISVRVEQDSQTLTDICTIVLPKKVKWDKSTKFPLGYGDFVKVALGYNKNLTQVFEGYITGYSLESPITIQCQDAMFEFKAKAAIKLSYEDANLVDILMDQKLGMPFAVYGVDHIGPFRVEADTVAGLLQQLAGHGVRSNIGVSNGGTALICGTAFNVDTTHKAVFTEKNIIERSKLELERADEIKLRVMAVSHQEDNTMLKAEAGDKEGPLRVKKYSNQSKEMLDKLAQEELDRMKVDGLKGSFTTFGHQLVNKLDSVAIKIDGAKLGVYQVKKNIISYGLQGLRQEITLGGRV